MLAWTAWSFLGFDRLWFDLYCHLPAAGRSVSCCNAVERGGWIPRLPGSHGTGGTVALFTRQQHPGDAGHFVGQGNRHLIGMFTLQQGFQPGLAAGQAGLLAAAHMPQYRLRPLHQ